MFLQFRPFGSDRQAIVFLWEKDAKEFPEKYRSHKNVSAQGEKIDNE